MVYVGPREKQLRKKNTKHAPLFPRHKQWQQCYDSWLRAAYERSGSYKTRYTFRGVTSRFFTDPKRAPDQYTRAEVEEYVHKPVYHKSGTRSPAPATQNERRNVLSSFYSFAAQYDVKFRNGTRPLLHTPPPTRGIQQVKVGHKRRDLSEDELRRLFAAIPRENKIEKRDYALLLMYFWTARRLTEILRLKWRDIFEVTFVVDGEMIPGHMYRYTPKAHARETFTAELPQPAWDALIDYLKASGRLERMKPDTPLFVRLDNGKILDEEERAICDKTPRKIMAKYAALAGLDISEDRQISPHSLRHTRARLTYKRDPSEKALTKIQQLLGHNDMTTTLIYLRDADHKPDDTASLLYADFGKL